MSILNIRARPEKVWVYTDTWTAARTDDVGGRLAVGHASKLMQLSASNCVLAFRGHLVFGASAAFNAGLIPNAGFDQLLHIFPTLLGTSWAEYARQFGPAGVVAADSMRQELALVGWSDRRGRMDAVVFMKDEAEGFVAFDAFSQAWATPWADEWGPLLAMDTEADHLALARRQVELTQAEAPRVAIGGRLVGAEVTRASTRLFRAGDL